MHKITTGTLLAELQISIDRLSGEFDKISGERRSIIRQLTSLVTKKTQAGEPILLNFICTHNSRRSHISQLWAQAAAYYYGIKNVQTFSGGTEATAFNPRAVKAMQEAGFDITIKNVGSNPIYTVKYSEEASPIQAFSKTYDDPFNRSKDFIAVMTCSHADENCPLVMGAAARVALTYDDPKEYDGTALEATKYTERVNEIGREILYAFSQVK